MAEKEYVFETTEKYLKKLDGDLAGRTFRLAMDNGEEYQIRFLDGEILEWRREGELLRWEKYGCLKADDSTFFVASVLGGTEVCTCVTMVIDEENSLVTMCISRQGIHPLRPRLAEVEYIFGAIRVPGRPLPEKRHSFTRDLVGKKIVWHYANGFINTHIYQSERYYRIVPLTDTRTPEEVERDNREIELGLRPKEMLYEEPARFIRIKDGMYLISFVEDNMNRVDPGRGGNNMIVLENLKGGVDCGRTFSVNRQGRLEHGFFRAYGEPVEEDFPIENEPTPYRVTGEKTMTIAVLGPESSLKARFVSEALHRGHTVTGDADTADAAVEFPDGEIKITRNGQTTDMILPEKTDTDYRRTGYYRFEDGKAPYAEEGDIAMAAVDMAMSSDPGTFFIASDKVSELPQGSDGRRRYVAQTHKGIAGKVFHVVMDSMDEFVVRFLTDELLEMSYKGEFFEKHACSCMECDDGVWFVTVMRGEECFTMVLDTVQALVTTVTTSLYPGKMQMVRHSIGFGAIAQAGKDTGLMRHCFTEDLVGKKVTWHYSPYVSITHCYISENYMRSSLGKMKPLPEDAPEEAVFDAMDRYRRWGSIFFEEPCQYIRINKHLYVVCTAETNRNRVDPLEGGGAMVYAFNTRRMQDYGRGFFTGMAETYPNLFSVYGEWDDDEDPMDTAESPYDI